MPSVPVSSSVKPKSRSRTYTTVTPAFYSKVSNVKHRLTTERSLPGREEGGDEAIEDMIERRESKIEKRYMGEERKMKLGATRKSEVERE